MMYINGQKDGLLSPCDFVITVMINSSIYFCNSTIFELLNIHKSKKNSIGSPTRPAMHYGSNYWEIKNQHVQK